MSPMTKLRSWLELLVRRVRRNRLAWMALRDTTRFLEWVNAERCGVDVWNDPSGRWNVRFGTMVPHSSGRTIGEAACHQFLMLENHKDWVWTIDYLKSPNTEAE